MWTFLVCLLRRRSSCWEFISWNYFSHGEMPDKAMEKLWIWQCSRLHLKMV
jgi:hypothetical protein